MNEKIIIYMATNKVNGKKYIGKTIRGLKKRKSQHLRDVRNGSQSHFHRAIRFYGEDVFVWEVIYVGSSDEEILQKEIEFISIHDTYNNGYNLTKGGEGLSGYSFNFGENSGNAILTEVKVKKIIHLIQNTTMSYPEIAKIVGASENNVRIIGTGKGWNHLYDEAPFKNRPDGANVQKRITEKQARMIINLIERTDLPSHEIADIVGTSSSNVRQISQGKTWTHLYEIPPAKVRKLRKKWRKAFEKKHKIKVDWSQVPVKEVI